MLTSENTSLLAIIGAVGTILGYLLSFVGKRKDIDSTAAGKLRDQLLRANEQYVLQLQGITKELEKNKDDYETLRQQSVEIGNSLQKCLTRNILLEKEINALRDALTVTNARTKDR